MPVQATLALSLKCLSRGLQQSQPAAKQCRLIGEMFCSLPEVTCERKGAEEYKGSSRACGLCAPQHILHRKLDSLVEEMGKLISPEEYCNARHSQSYF